MNRFLVCYEIDGKIYVDAKSDFKQIRFTEGYDRVIILEERFCQSKKMEVKFTKLCLSNYTKEL
jgi:hypothetical protein